jgi:PhnB protein
MSPVNAYLVFDGNGAEALRYYERVLPRAKLDMLMTFGQMPGGDGQMPPDVAKRLMHGRLVFDGGLLMASDSMVGHPYEGMKGFGVALFCADNAEAKRTFDALAEGGTVTMPMQATFWCEAFGMVTDRFGAHWMVNGTAINFS